MTNLQYINRGKPHYKLEFCEEELDSNMVSKLILTRFVGLIIPSTIGFY